MTNSSKSPKFLAAIAILTAAALVCTWAGAFVGGLAGAWAWSLGLQLVLPLGGLLLLLIAVVSAIRRRRWSRVHTCSLLVALVALWPTLWFFGLLPMSYPSSIDEQQPSASVRVPLDGQVVVLWGGDELAHNYHAAYPDQRWAYDLAVEPVLTMSDNLEDYGCYGKAVIAPADGTVVSARGDLPDHTPGELSNDFDNPIGNHVTLKLDETQTYLVLAHLRRDSVQVTAGQKVRRGQLLGECGNSGNTSEPHLHIHHQRQSPAEAMTGFAEGLPLYFKDHRGEPMPRGGIDASTEPPTATGAIISHGR